MRCRSHRPSSVCFTQNTIEVIADFICQSSLVTTLQAAEKFNKEHLSSPEIAPLIDNAKYVYVGGFFLTHGIESAVEVAKKAATAGKVNLSMYSRDLSHDPVPKVFTTNLSAPFIPQFFKEQLDTLLPYCDIVIGNEAESEAYANAHGLSDPKDLPAVAKHIASWTKVNPSRPRIVVITQGPDPTIVVTSDDVDNHKVSSLVRIY